MVWINRLFIIINTFLVVLTNVDLLLSLGLPPPADDGLHGDDDFKAQITKHTAFYMMERIVVTMVILVVSILGVCGALKKNLVALTVFLGFMVASSLLMLKVRVTAASVRPQLERLMEEWWRPRLPLDQASDNIRNWVGGLQSSFGCCGVFSYKDWDDNIPDSCLCSHEEEEGTKGSCQTINYRNFLLNLLWQKKFVHMQSCFPFIMMSVRITTDVPLPLNVSLFVLMLLASVLSSLMIYQMIKASNRPHAPLSVAPTLTDDPPAYNQLYNLPD